MLLVILLVIQILISIALVAVVLMQRSEGGALGMGGGPTGFMTARGAGNLLTTITWWLGGAFAVCALSLTIVGNMTMSTGSAFDAEDIGSAVAPTAPVDGAPTDPAAPPPATPGEGDSLSLDSLPAAGSAPAEAPAQ